MGLTQVSTKGIKDATILDEDIAVGTITAARLGNDCVGTAELQNSAVETVNINNGAVTKGKIENLINNNADNRVITGSGTANTLNGESNLLFDGSKLLLGTTTSAAGDLVVKDTTNAGNQVWIVGRSNNDTGSVSFRNNADDAYRGRIQVDNSNGMQFQVQGSERMRIDSSGNVGIGTSSPTYKNAVFGGSQRTFHISGTAAPQLRIQSSTAGQADLFLQAGNSGSDAIIGNAGSNGDLVFNTNNGSSQGTRLRILDDGGICFNSDTAAANALDDYEEGTWDPTVTTSNGGTITLNASIKTLNYVKIGKTVTISGRILLSSFSGSNGVLQFSLPFATSGGGSGQSDYAHFMCNTHGFNLHDSTVQVFGEAGASATHFSLFQVIDNGNWTGFDSSQLNNNNNEYIGFVGSYRAG